jgi:hypothetical protein
MFSIVDFVSSLSLVRCLGSGCGTGESDLDVSQSESKRGKKADSQPGTSTDGSNCKVDELNSFESFNPYDVVKMGESSWKIFKISVVGTLLPGCGMTQPLRERSRKFLSADPTASHHSHHSLSFASYCVASTTTVVFTSVQLEIFSNLQSKDSSTVFRLEVRPRADLSQPQSASNILHRRLTTHRVGA